MYWGRHLVKMLKAVDVLSQPGGATIDDIAERLNVDVRTAYRVRATLEELNFPLYEDNSHLDGKKRFRFDGDYLKKLPNLSLPELQLTLAELVALYFLRGHGALFRGTDIEQNIEAAFSKLDAFVPNDLARNLEKVKTLFVPALKNAKDYSDKEEIIAALTDGIFLQRTCTVAYHAFHDDKVKTFQIDPLRFFERDGGLYLFVNTTKYGHIRVLAVERIQSITVDETTFECPKDFDPDALLGSAFGIIYDDPVQVTIRFSSQVARYIRERNWAREQTLTDEADGSVTLSMQTSGWIDIKRWVLSFGAEALVLEPEELREEIREEVGKTLGRY